MEYKFKQSVATAYCLKGDKFDERIGMNVSRTKAENKAYKQAQKLIDERCAELAFFLGAADRFSAKREKHNSHNEEYIKRITE